MITAKEIKYILQKYFNIVLSQKRANNETQTINPTKNRIKNREE